MLDRRDFLMLTAGVLSHKSPHAASLASRSAIKAIAFDAFPIFDPRPVAALVESQFPGQGAAIMLVWRARQFEYQWLRALAGRYVNFLQATEDSLLFTLEQLQLELSTDKRQQLMLAWSNLTVWPDVLDAITALRNLGLRLVLLSNMTDIALQASLKKAGINHAFEAVLSTDQIRSYKPDPKAYQLAIDYLQLPREEVLFVAFAGWDVAGAKWFGYPTYWMNRLASPAEALGIEADASGQDMSTLLQFLARA
jgi:2-haloacid dehalogenase